jgi:lipopolysaccharide export system protein LptA
VTGDRGVFDMRTNTVTMHGNVLLTKDKNVLRGDRLVVDLTTVFRGSIEQRACRACSGRAEQRTAGR